MTVTVSVVVLATLALAAAEPRRLHAPSADASSFLKSNWNKFEENYHPSYALDDDPKTAWVEGVDGDGTGQKWWVDVSKLKSARTVRVVIANGYQKSAALLAQNAAPKRVTLVVYGPDGAESARRTVDLKKAMGKQSFDLAPTKGVARVELIVDEAWPGTRYKDLCVSDIQVLVDSDVPYVARAELAKRATLIGWKKERLALARTFATLPSSWPYAAKDFAEQRAQGKSGPLLAKPRNDDDFVDHLPELQSPVLFSRSTHPLLAELGVHRADLAMLADLVEGKRAGALKRADAKNTSPRPEGLGGLPWITLDEVTLFEATGGVEQRKLWAEQCCADELPPGVKPKRWVAGRDEISPLVVFVDDAKHTWIYEKRLAVREERATSTITTHALHHYDDRGRLAGTVTWEKSASNHQYVPTLIVRASRVQWSAADKVDRVSGVQIDNNLYGYEELTASTFTLDPVVTALAAAPAAPAAP